MNPERRPDRVPLSQQQRHWARLPYPLLLLGERGTGKTALARALHDASGRPGAFIVRSLTHFTPGLELATLVGHKRGAFTGAMADRIGDLRRAERGTLLLDELGRASGEVQGILLDLIERREFTPIGATQPEAADVRLIAATNADLEALVAKGAFAADLLDRFGFFRLHLLPLRDRREEILPLVRLHLRLASTQLGRTDPPRVSPQLAHLLKAAPWPGNIRDVVKLCQYLAAEAGQIATPDDLPPGFPERRRPGRPALPELELTPRERAWRAVKATGGNKSAAARQLGTSRAQLYRLLKGGESEGRVEG